MGGLAAAWLAGEALVAWRIIHTQHRPPAPGALLGITVLFAALGAAASYAPARPVVTALAWGLDVAAFFNALPAGLQSQIGQAQKAEGQEETGNYARAESVGSAAAGKAS